MSLLRLLGTGASQTDPAPAASGPRALKRRISRGVTVKLVNPLVIPLVQRGLLEPGWAVLETTGRASGEPRQVPIGNGLRGDQFWIVTEHGRHAHYVRNIEADPRVRVFVGGRWRAGTAHVLPDDDPYARLRWLRRPVNDAALLTVGTEQLVVRVDLDPDGAA
ncbi:MAG TPA: nitroreductase/quinone reductase family protein [Capillimicrobium sp.]|jgi:deazaflavin-dependent oxidoreductase (nitroreductase family)